LLNAIRHDLDDYVGANAEHFNIAGQQYILTSTQSFSAFYSFNNVFA